MKISSEQEMITHGQTLAGDLLASRSSRDHALVIELVGDVGAGKTTLTRGLAAGFGVSEPIMSPSYTISKRYALPSGGELIHYDFYRLPDPGLMAEDLAESIADPANIIIVEWADSVADLLPSDSHTIKIETQKDATRIVIS